MRPVRDSVLDAVAELSRRGFEPVLRSPTDAKAALQIRL